ncbi:Hexaprenyldihydroxybenzoate methyltransferase, mitochondrial [Allomyces javanicus]|nr:Hexaprenyldihydroxybenzoate methyltransferase, mitochondrial [Allomyces javanicus]
MIPARTTRPVLAALASAATARAAAARSAAATTTAALRSTLHTTPALRSENIDAAYDPSPSLSTANASEVAKFNALAAQWWDPHGEFGLLHRMNPVRVGYIREFTDAFAGGIAGKRVLDIGSGGGLLSESLARLGAVVVGADAAEENTKMATAHAERDPVLRNKLHGSLQYRNVTAESLRDAGEEFDTVCALEIIEHVDHPEQFLQACIDMVPSSSGLVFISTMNRTALAKFLTVTLAEDVLGLVSRGTHDANKYITPKELRGMAYRCGAQVLDIDALWLNPLTKTWSRGMHGVSEDHLVNYIACLRKK